ncbi:MAG: O-antigen ligase family protein [Acidocella sp.]|nr:O-antigen ligase family protein [Acidocella sp.]
MFTARFAAMWGQAMAGEWRQRVALVATLAVPFGLLHAFVGAEICIALVDILFLVEMGRRRDFAWVGRPWFVVALLWWGWLVVCSLPGIGVAGWALGFAQAVVVIRLLLFTAALQSWILTGVAARRAAWVVLALALLWIGVEAWQQLLTGRNIFGDPRWPDGSLTGPFWKPRAGALYAHLLFIGVLPPAMGLFARPRRVWRAAGAALLMLGVATSVLIGQRMGVALTGLGVVVCCLFIPRLRLAGGIAVGLGVLVLLASPVISPPTHAKLVGETTRNFSHFSQSPYGEIFSRAVQMGLKSPVFGWGYNGYRVDCPLPRFAPGLPLLGVPPTQLALAACNLHPQNYFIQAFADAGLPGLVLFTALALVWMTALARGLWRQPDPLRVGLFMGVLSFTWPLASTDEFPTLYMLGWMFFFLGLGLACADAASEARGPEMILEGDHG